MDVDSARPPASHRVCANVLLQTLPWCCMRELWSLWWLCLSRNQTCADWLSSWQLGGWLNLLLVKDCWSKRVIIFQDLKAAGSMLPVEVKTAGQPFYLAAIAEFSALSWRPRPQRILCWTKLLHWWGAAWGGCAFASCTSRVHGKENVSPLPRRRRSRAWLAWQLHMQQWCRHNLKSRPNWKLW